MVSSSSLGVSSDQSTEPFPPGAFTPPVEWAAPVALPAPPGRPDDGPSLEASGSGDAEVPSASMGLLDLIQDPEDKARLSHLTAVMSLLEGHANVVMDGIDSSVVPTVKTIRQRFDHRSAHRSALDRWMRRLMGMDAKMRQYRDGQRFVKHAVQQMGMDAFNIVWDGPEHLPTETELHHPQQWVERMRGRS